MAQTDSTAIRAQERLLTSAAADNDLQAIKRLLDSGVNVDARTIAGATALAKYCTIDESGTVDAPRGCTAGGRRRITCDLNLLT
jgi:hypothetical protein